MAIYDDKQTSASKGEALYNLLPETYRQSDGKIDPNPYPLKRFFTVAGTGFDFLNDKIAGYSSLFDIDNTPKELLPHIAKMMGFDYPYEMTEQEQRSLLKILPILYNLKGTASVFNYLSQQVFTKDSSTTTSWNPRQVDSNGVLINNNQIVLNVSVNGDLNDINMRMDRFKKYADKFRPVNNELYMVLALFYEDLFDRNNMQEDFEELYLIDDNYVTDSGIILLESYDSINVIGEDGEDLATDGDLDDDEVLDNTQAVDDYGETLTEDPTDEPYSIPDIYSDSNTEIVYQDDDVNGYIQPSMLLNTMTLGNTAGDLTGAWQEDRYDATTKITEDTLIETGTTDEGTESYTLDTTNSDSYDAHTLTVDDSTDSYDSTSIVEDFGGEVVSEDSGDDEVLDFTTNTLEDEQDDYTLDDDEDIYDDTVIDDSDVPDEELTTIAEENEDPYALDPNSDDGEEYWTVDDDANPLDGTIQEDMYPTQNILDDIEDLLASDDDDVYNIDSNGDVSEGITNLTYDDSNETYVTTYALDDYTDVKYDLKNTLCSTQVGLNALLLSQPTPIIP